MKYKTFREGYDLFTDGLTKTTIRAWFGWFTGFSILASLTRIMAYVFEQLLF